MSCERLAAPSPPRGAFLSVPRPPLWFIIPILGILDGCSTIALGLILPCLTGSQGSVEALLAVFGIARAAIVGCVGCSREVRGLGWAIAAVGVASFLAFLARLNTLLLGREHLSWSTRLFLPTAVIFPLLHWGAFLVCVGVRRRRNPFAGKGLGLSRDRRVGSRWGEESVRIERVGVIGEGEFADVGSLLLNSDEDSDSGQEADLEVVNVASSGSDGADSPSESDPDDIQDLPPPAATPLTPTPPGSAPRHRKVSTRSRGSVRSFGKSVEQRSYVTGA